MSDSEDDWSDIEEGDFSEVETPSKLKTQLDPVMLSVVRLGRNKTARIQFSIDPTIIEQLGANRMRVDWNNIKGVYRLRSSNEGKHQVNTFARSPRCWVRVMFPDADLYEIEGSYGAKHQVNLTDKSLLVKVPRVFFEEPAKAPQKQEILPPYTPQRVLAAPIKPRHDVELDDPKIVRAALGLPAISAPTKVGGERFTPAEAEVVRLLSQRSLVSKQMILLATRDPENPDEDDRNEKLADVYLCKIKPKLTKLGFTIKTQYGQGYTMPIEDRTRLKRLISEE